jgi:hypothetical protein
MSRLVANERWYGGEKPRFFGEAFYESLFVGRQPQSIF